jgi:type III secretory pathway lipoprotein EscJ
VKIGHILALGLLASGCGAHERPSGPGPGRPEIAPDKDSLFGDPGLVPTREGEHIRRELAAAGEIDRAVTTLSGVERARANVELARQDHEPPRVLVAARLDPAGDRSVLRQQINSVIRGVVGEIPDENVTVVLAAPSAPLERPVPALSLVLAMCLVGLGSSAGVAADRLLRWRRARPRRRRRG